MKIALIAAAVFVALMVLNRRRKPEIQPPPAPPWAKAVVNLVKQERIPFHPTMGAGSF